MKFGDSEFQNWKHAFAKPAININHILTSNIQNHLYYKNKLIKQILQ